MRRCVAAFALGVALLATAGCSSTALDRLSSSATASAPASATAGPSPASIAPIAPPLGRVPQFQHVVIVVEENHGTAEAMRMQYLGELRRSGAAFPNSHGVAHPSQPNYLALWSGSTHGVTSDACPQDLGTSPSLGSQLIGAGHTVAAYSEGLPEAGSLACVAGPYARKHNPLADFTATAGAAHNLPFSAFPADYSRLPSVALVVPNLDHDAHNGSMAAADDWLRSRLGGYASWAATHDSLLIVTFDEQESDRAANRILTVLTGAHVRPGTYTERIDHVSVLHTVQSAFGLAPLGAAAAPITDAWQ
jgi:acid phosphatase